MHPPLDRPHPDCQDVIKALKACHKDTWKKYTGGCNEAKVALDQCFGREKKRLLAEENKDWGERQVQQQEIMKDVFGRQETYYEFLAKDPEYQKEMAKHQQPPPPQTS
uniref:COX assembly mitochondrial protein n=1 Tax=Entomoneis paludosa TaxID=265537 RepID=A0A7S3DN66_9STRA|mmetsp:Transcript_22376/g.46674  ORF Transcript_22376/g.46674 Transcript_22376/m.46674 type:complete len:108 (+) Transcript_22376:1-324(+)